MGKETRPPEVYECTRCGDVNLMPLLSPWCPACLLRYLARKDHTAV